VKDIRRTKTKKREKSYYPKIRHKNEAREDAGGNIIKYGSVNLRSKPREDKRNSQILDARKLKTGRRNRQNGWSVTRPAVQSFGVLYGVSASYLNEWRWGGYGGAWVGAVSQYAPKGRSA